jgi:hypothetical protein
MNKVIVVCKLGWVFVGDMCDKDTQVKLINASVVRRWGTTRGLGEIALSGPTKDTVLDYAGSVVVERDSVLFYIACEAKKWPTYS